MNDLTGILLALAAFLRGVACDAAKCDIKLCVGVLKCGNIIERNNCDFCEEARFW